MGIADQAILALIVLASVSCGLVGGIFFAFSAFVMRALSRPRGARGIAAMQSINLVVLNPWFMTAFFGTAVACVVSVIPALSRWPDPPAAFILAGSLLYLLGCIGVTIVCNVPRNNALAAVTPKHSQSADVWTRYLADWTAWNHVRTIASLAAAASFGVALVF